MLVSEVHQVSISYVFWLGNLLLLAYPSLESCLQRKYTLTLPFHLSSKKENLYSYLCLRQPKAWYWLYPFAPSLRTVFSTRRAPSAYSVYHLTLTDRLTSPQPVGEKNKKTFEEEHYRKSVVWLHYLKGGRKRFPLYDYATCLPLGKTAFFFAIRQPLKTFKKRPVCSAVYIFPCCLFLDRNLQEVALIWTSESREGFTGNWQEFRISIYLETAEVEGHLLALCSFQMMQLKVWKL